MIISADTRMSSIRSRIKGKPKINLAPNGWLNSSVNIVSHPDIEKVTHSKSIEGLYFESNIIERDRLN